MSERFLRYVPQLLRNAQFRNHVRAALGERGEEILQRVQNSLPLEIEDQDELLDAASDAYADCAEQILTLAWDGDAPGMSGALWLSCCEGIYMIGSSDEDDLGPFSSLEEALKKGCFNTVTANPELSSHVLPKETLLKIARQVVDWENEGTIAINSEIYRVSDSKLISANSEQGK